MFTLLSRLLTATLLCLSWGAQAGDATDFVTAPPAQQAQLLERWAITPDAARMPLLNALQQGTLSTDSRNLPFIEQNGGAVAADGNATPEGALKKVRLNNRLRGLVASAQASHQLVDPSPAVRLDAARLLQKNANSEQIPLLSQQLAAETNAEVKAVLAQVLAGLKLNSRNPAERLEAVRLLGESNEPSTPTRLRAFLADTETNTIVRHAAEVSLAQVERRLFFGELLGHAFSGLSLGSVLLLAALGLAITFGLLGVINMAHGEMLMIGAYTTYMVQLGFQTFAPNWLNFYPLLALPVAFFVTAGIGMALERGVIRHLYGRPLETLLATWGISLILIQLVRVLFGAQNVEVANPTWLSGGWQVLPNLVLPYSRMAIIGFSLSVVALTWLLLNKTRLGLNVRAVTQNRHMAACCGVPTGRVDMLAFGLGSGIAGLGGVALSQIGNVGPDLGQGYIIDSFLVVVLGGVGQLAGSVMAAFGLGIMNKLLEPQIGAVLGKILILALIILFIQKRPQGLFALKGRVID